LLVVLLRPLKVLVWFPGDSDGDALTTDDGDGDADGDVLTTDDGDALTTDDGDGLENSA